MIRMRTMPAHAAPATGRGAWLTRAAFILLLAVVAARGMLGETLHDSAEPPLPRGPSPRATI